MSDTMSTDDIMDDADYLPEPTLSTPTTPDPESLWIRRVAGLALEVERLREENRRLIRNANHYAARVGE